ncbi:MAG: peptidase dimerization domain-containing protein [Bacilli bacterium]|nr:peptidase dimerization domain-containing protein [Bacilli bacterium]
MKGLLDDLEKSMPYIMSLREYFHINAEAGGLENKTSKRIIKELKKLKVDYEIINHYTVIAYINRDRKKKAIAFRTGIDGFEIMESEDNEYISKNNQISHVSANDCNVASMLGIIKVLKENEKKLNSKAIFIFESNSTLESSSTQIINSGLLDKIEYLYGTHLISYMNVNTYEAKSGYQLVGMNAIKIKWYGNNISTALNDNKHDLIRAGSHFAFNIVGAIANDIDSKKIYKVSMTEFKAGGYYNIIPDYCEMTLNIRFQDLETKKEIHRLISEYLKVMENRFGVKTKSYVINDVEPLCNDEKAVAFVLDAIDKIKGNKIIDDLNVKMLSETLSNYAKKYKTSLIAVGSKSKDEDQDDFFTKDYFPKEDAIYSNAKIMMQLCIDYMVK